MGVTETIDYRENQRWGDAARVATGGRGVDVAVEVGGPGTFDQTVRALRFGGTMSILGVLTGVQGPVNTYAIFHKNLRVHGVYVGSVAMFDDLVRALETTGIEPVIDAVFPFEEARAAYEHLDSGAHFGKVVVTI
jgi:NADPH:quinone reductase-like Zn-dependent oxidoreductase